MNKSAAAGAQAVDACVRAIPSPDMPAAKARATACDATIITKES